MADSTAPPPSGLTSILKPAQPYDPEQDADAQFFPSEPAPPSSALPRQEEEDPETAGLEDDYDDEDGTLWSGPAAKSVPTSVSGFRMRARSRGEFERQSKELNRTRSEAEDNDEGDSGDDAKSRKSSRSRVSSRSRRHRSSSRRSRRQSNASDVTATTSGETDAESVRTTSRSSRPRLAKRQSSSRSKSRHHSGSDSGEDEEASVGFFEGISNALRGRRPSMVRNESNASRASSIHSRRSRARCGAARQHTDSDAVSLRSESEAGDALDGTENGDDDPYGPYGSDDDTTSTSTQSSTSSQEGTRRRRTGGGMVGLPGGGAGDFFAGESRIDFSEVDDDEMSSLGSEDGHHGASDGDKKGPPTHQLIYIADEDLPLRFVGLRLIKPRVVLWWIACVLSLGSLWLVGRWLPNMWRKSVGKPGEFAIAEYVVVEVRLSPSFLLSPSGSN